MFDRLEPRRLLAASYAITDLGVLDHHEFEYSEGYGINNSGTVAGLSDTGQVFFVDEDGNPFYINHAFRADAKTGMIDLGSDSLFSAAFNINDKGEAVGVSEIAGIPDPFNGGLAGHPVIWDNRGAVIDLGTTPGKVNGAGWGINNQGDVVGWTFNDDPEALPPDVAPPNSVPFVYDNHDGIRELPMPTGYKNGFAGDINDAGVIAGNAADNSTVHPLAWIPGPRGSYNVLDLGFQPGFNRGDTRAINNRGQLAGNLVNATTGGAEAFIWTPGPHGSYVATNIGKPAGAFSAVSRDINNRGEVVGIARFGSRNRAFVYDATGMHNLNDLIAPGSGWVLNNARSINDKGQITCLAFDGDFNFHALVLTPATASAATQTSTFAARLFSNTPIQSSQASDDILRFSVRIKGGE